ncbi:TonB-dependent receptor domain-containing protein [Candidatus Latescibacterota bacterium]
MTGRASALATWLLLIAPLAARADQRDLSGFVYDADSGDSLPYASVVVTGTHQGALTNANGYFVVVNAPAQLCTLQVSYIGYHSQLIAIDNRSARQEPLRVELQVEAVGLAETVVEAEARYEVWKPGAEVSQITFSPRQLGSLPALGEADIFRSLQLLPGISGVGDGSAGLYIRGGTPDQNLIIYDGMTVYHVDHFYGVFSAFNANAVKDIRVYKGGYPAKYGGRLSSVVELSGRSGDVNRVQLSGGVNLLSAHMFLEVPVLEMGSWVVAARRSYTDVMESGLYSSLFDLTQDDDVVLPARAQSRSGRLRGQLAQQTTPLFYFYDLNSKLTLSPTSSDFISFSLYSGRDNQQEDGEMAGLGFRRPEAADVAGTRTDENETDWGNLGGSARWGRRWHDRLFANLLVSSSVYSSDYYRNRGFTGADANTPFQARALYEEDNRVEDTALRLDLEWAAHSAHQIDFGLGLSDIRTEYYGTFGDSLNVLDISTRARETSLYLQDRWSPMPVLELTAGVRATQHDATDSLYVEPRASIAWDLTDRFRLKSAWGRYHQYINNVSSEDVLQGNRDFWLVADEAMPPGAAEHAIVGARYETTGYLYEVEAYHKDMGGLVEFSRRLGRGLQADYLGSFFYGEGIARGIELLFQRKMGTVNGWLSYTLGEVEHTFPDINDGQPFPASHDRRHEINAVTSYHLGPWTASATWVFASGQAYTAPESQYTLAMADGQESSYVHIGEVNGSRLPDYHRLDLSLSRHFETQALNCSAGLTLFNAYNRSNVQSREYDLEVSPILITDVTMLGFTPSVYFEARFK